MDAGSWMEAFERASERLVEDWQVKLVTTGLLAEGVFPVELISLFALAVFIDLVTKWMAAFDGYGIGSGDPDMRWDLLYVPDYGDGGRLVPGGELIRGKTKYYRKQRSGLLCL